MERIDTSGWKAFKIGSIFEVVKGTRLTKANMREGNTKFVGSSAMNNGETARVSNDNHLHPSNTITVCYNGSVGETFYQDEEFWASDDVNVLYPKFDMSQFIALFICPIIKRVGQKYAFIDKWKQEDMKVTNIFLPVTADGKPDFAYMDKYMRKIVEESEMSLENLRRADKSRQLMDTQGWKLFRLGELFDIVKGTRLTKADQRDGQINFISASSFNNGIAGTISNDEHIHPGNTMTVSYNGSDIGRTFYQEEPFWASDDVNVLYPKFQLTKSIALFMAPLIKAVGGSHVYKDKWLQDDMKVAEIMLPVTMGGKPDWDYMDTYMSAILETTSGSLDLLVEATS